MPLDTYVRHLEADRDRLRAENTALREQVRQLAAQVQTLQEQVSRARQDSHNSSKPPSSDGFTRRTKSLRQRSGKAPGGQSGHRGTHRAVVATPDLVLPPQRPARCAACGMRLDGVAAEGIERRQVWELPPVRLVVTEHQAEQVRCPCCQTRTTGPFPATVRTAVQYGPRVQALAVYLSQYQLLPFARVRELLADVLACPLSVGTLVAMVQRASAALRPAEDSLKTQARHAGVLHHDQTGVRVAGRWHWAQVACTRHLTHLAVQPTRGHAALDAVGILPEYAGTLVHDAAAVYAAYPAQHAQCNVHVRRELAFIAEEIGADGRQAWASALHRSLLAMKRVVDRARVAGRQALPTAVRAAWRARYRAHLLAGITAQPPLPDSGHPGRAGRHRQGPARNLLDRLWRDEDALLRFLDDFAVPFDNNQAERDLRMLKVQQKISGSFRSAAGAQAFCRIRSALSTGRKRGQNPLVLLQRLFDRHALLLQLGPE